MAPDIEVMRAFVRKMYDGDRWKRRVKKMPDGQVAAIYIKEQKKAAQAKARGKTPKSDIPF